tara:strand:- start:99 stop:275 length:177 start_codon:yes stop_codon:yes gene_type:complete
LLLIAPVFGFGQDYKTYDFETLLLCTDLQTYSFSDNSEASKLVDTILGVVLVYIFSLL